MGRIRLLFVALLTAVLLVNFLPSTNPVGANTSSSSSVNLGSSSDGSTSSYPAPSIPISSYEMLPTTSSTSTLVYGQMPMMSTSPSTTLAPKPGATIEQLPIAGETWPQCFAVSDEYCWEAATTIDSNGVEAAATTGGAYAYCHQGLGFSDKSQCKTDGSFWFEMGYSNVFTQEDLNSTYRWRVRTGKFSPDILMLGDAQRVAISGNATDGWVIEISARPALKAYKSGCSDPRACDETSVAESVQYAISGYMRSLGIGDNKWPSVESETLRDSLRGTFISTNGMTQSWKFAADTFNVSAFGPHFLPDGKTVSPGYVKVFLPEAYVVKQRGYASISDVTAENLAVTVRGESIVPTISIVANGLLVDTGVTHYSDPNPSVKVLPGPLMQTSKVSSVKRGRTLALTSIYKKKAGEVLRYAARGQCVLRGARILALKKAGSCNVTISAKRGVRYVVVARKTLRVV